jgi:pantothenate kinase type III
MFECNNSELVINIDNFESEEENTETENEVKELDEYLIHSISDIISLSIEKVNCQYFNAVLLFQFKEIDSPPPVI